ncbi:Lactoylglutathione lyase [Yamadazyma tenuis]|uniref:Lactoylglutathione lyase n=1 Tax=Candida tenuis (strain ATCC 10573 / BCRC 21748 / CBS 615 / JCM 9827 / NBRC 10315 / NRRL Y-1498 / VKM Y-70) TaxID=590646 RepID=G3AZ70_CANTC|nr:glyoxalase I [Yamadazyma tenuis ATCC 10573]XP_006684858.1 uncharacterized protein CANTEDRAFT_112882 [Yamadazyma tenuis ATCC 10573]EGV66283.1 glyoxalase I [Yamadazyma tenuis ATCC 10573]EGV66284.1 hypothetical protein CANTEDRAFT_112882 [Yamadazyma tenuis ATCC 10573]WEJ95639.1 Lactoylglutathione lyase [Yamadazyma tenuis]
MTTIDNSFIINHSCLRVKDPKVSIPFYENNFGMKCIRRLHFDGFSLYLLGFETEANKDKSWGAREGVLELCHNHGSEDDDSFKVNNGNGTENRGFGHICVSVDNIQVCEANLLANGAKFQKKLSDGRQKDIAFVLDPDGYWVELVEHQRNKTEAKTDLSTYKFNHTMIRVKDAKKSLDFYKNKFGMKLLSTFDFPDARFTLFFLGYDHANNHEENSIDKKVRHFQESLLELTYNYGTEEDTDFHYHNGNSTDNGAIQGYGHIGVSCKDPATFCKQLEDKYGDELDWSVQWGKGSLTPNLAFIRDPDGYSVEIIPLDIFSDDSKL